MKWFEGSIAEAVSTSKSRKAIFVVFVEGKDDTSEHIAAVINTTEVSARLEQDDFVAVRVEGGSSDYRHFARLYHLVLVPSIFFIGTNGIPLVVVCGRIEADDLLAKIDLMLTVGGKNPSSSSLIDAEKKASASGSIVTTASTSSKPITNLESDNTINSNVDASLKKTTIEAEPVVEKTTEKIESNNAPAENAKVEPSPVDKPSNVPSSSSGSQNTCIKKTTGEDTTKKVQRVMELQQKNLMKDEERKEKLRELERRKDLEMKQAREERLREKAVNAAAKEKVRLQIAQDKLERKQKEQNMQQQVQKPLQQESPKPVAPDALNVTMTRIQFKLPSGNPHIGQFESSNTLRDLRNYVVENIDLPFRQFAMTISFPRRELTVEENDKTLLELELVPTAVLLILPMKNSDVTATVPSSQDVGILSRIMWSCLGFYNYLLSFFTQGNRRNTPKPQNNQNNDAARSSDGTVIPNLQNVANSSGLVRRYLGDQGGTTIKTEGNIHRLHSGGDDNDENNTWNGNSTQQM